MKQCGTVFGCTAVVTSHSSDIFEDKALTGNTILQTKLIRMQIEHL